MNLEYAIKTIGISLIILIGILIVYVVSIGISAVYEPISDAIHHIITWIGEHLFGKKDEYSSYYNDGTPIDFYCSFDKFKTWYALNPNAYGLDPDYAYRYERRFETIPKNSRKYKIGFKGIDRLRYRHFVRNYNRMKPIILQNENLQKFLTEDIQDDINRLREQSRKEFQDSLDMIEGKLG